MPVDRLTFTTCAKFESGHKVWSKKVDLESRTDPINWKSERHMTKETQTAEERGKTQGEAHTWRRRTNTVWQTCSHQMGIPWLTGLVWPMQMGDIACASCHLIRRIIQEGWSQTQIRRRILTATRCKL